ncbi:MAG: hypothetical protein IKO49_06800 [Bacilli bacterium]|nr:hypothetical protein [Bacilli bacterium]
MGIFVIITYILFGIFLFIILNFLNKKYNLTLIEYISFSLIFMFLVASIYSKSSNIYLIIIFEFIANIAYTTYLKEENFFKYKKTIIMYIILIILGFIINQEVINKNNILLDSKDIKLIIWLLIILFLYNFSKTNEIKYSSDKFEEEKTSINDNEYIITNYAKLKNKYKDVIKINKSLTNIVYAGMIYLNYLRPNFLRKIDYFKFKLNGKKRKLGIMQIESIKMIDDVESIETSITSIEKINTKLIKKNIKKKEITKEIIKQYYKNYDTDEIIKIYEIITKFNED